MTFSVFPTTFWAEKHTSQIAVVWNKSEIRGLNLAPFFKNLPQQISWQLLDQIIAKFTQHLTACGVQPSQLVAYSGKNRFINLLCYCAVLTMGAKILMLNPLLTQSQRQKILEQNQVDFFITDKDFLSLSSFDTSQKIVSSFSLTNPATFTLTSGSSGQPKAVVHSIANHLASAEGVCELMDFKQQHSWLLSLPLFHVSGQGIVWRWLLQGSTLYIDQNKQSFWQTLSKVTHCSLVPTQLQRYLTWLEDRKVNQKILLGGANIPANLIEQANARGMTTFASYGLTEMASTVTATTNQTDNVGQVLLNREIKLVNNEIWVRGKTLALGYWIENSLHPLTNELGWFATKDGGVLENNQLIVTGRLDYMFISGGENIQPEEIEKVLFLSDLVQNVFVVPVDDQEFGAKPVAFVEFKQPFNEQAVRSLQKFAKDRLEKFKQPIAYFSLEEVKHLQKNGIKISRKALIEYVAQGRIISNPPPSLPPQAEGGI
ncbi:o-succinylbenzoate--CoA ligase [Pasteurella atlantica]